MCHDYSMVIMVAECLSIWSFIGIYPDRLRLEFEYGMAISHVPCFDPSTHDHND